MRFSSEQISFMCISALNQFLFGISLIVISPLIIWQWIVIRIEIFFSSSIRTLKGISSTYTVSDIESNTQNNVLFCLKVEGKLDVRKSLDIITKLVYRKGKDGNLLFPEFQMYWFKWFGCPLWKMEHNFNVSKHVFHVVIPNQINKDKFLSTFEKDFIRKPFKPNESPWEIALVDSIEDNQDWYILLKFHHSLADGQSVFKALMTCVDNYIPGLEIKMPYSSPFRRICKILSYPLVGIYETAILAWENDTPNPWKIPNEYMSPDSRLIVKSKHISTNDISRLSALQNVSFSAVLLSGVTSAIRSIMTKQGKRVPEYLLTRMPVPAPIKIGTEGLTNLFSAVFIKLPTGESDKEVRIKKCESEISILKNSTCPVTLFLTTNLLSWCPDWFQRQFPTKFQALQIGNFPGPKESVFIGGQKVVDMYFNTWSAQRNAVYISSLSYNGKIRIVANADPQIFKSENVLKEFVQEIEKQFE